MSRQILLLRPATTAHDRVCLHELVDGSTWGCDDWDTYVWLISASNFVSRPLHHPLRPITAPVTLSYQSLRSSHSDRAGKIGYQPMGDPGQAVSAYTLLRPAMTMTTTRTPHIPASVLSPLSSKHAANTSLPTLPSACARTAIYIAASAARRRSRWRGLRHNGTLLLQFKRSLSSEDVAFFTFKLVQFAREASRSRFFLRFCGGLAMGNVAGVEVDTKE
ncbi:hypothetical protein BJ912DRAFT_177626 [Pholiota molesta]|nr:hypothetical protein BJ912DRAFT_177626 [Pholiota molesta]